MNEGISRHRFSPWIPLLVAMGILDISNTYLRSYNDTLYYAMEPVFYIVIAMFVGLLIARMRINIQQEGVSCRGVFFTRFFGVVRGRSRYSNDDVRLPSEHVCRQLFNFWWPLGAVYVF